MKSIKAAASAIKRAFVSLGQLALEHKLACVCGALLFILVALPLLSTGIIINDELQRRLIAMSGFSSYASFSWTITTTLGRLLSFIPWTLSQYIDFMNSSALYMGLVKICLILLNIIVFGRFLYKVFKNIRLALFTSLAVLLTMPIVFEHTPPNAYSEYVLALTILIFALLCYIRYLESASIKPLIASSILLFIALCFYEVFIMYTPMYLFLAWRYAEGKEDKLRRAAHKLIGPIIAAVLYLALYICAQAIFPSNYDGNTLTLDSIGVSLAIIGRLALSSIPGFYWQSDKYIYLYRKLGGFFKLDLRLLFVNFISSARIVAIAILALIVLYVLFKKPSTELANKKRSRLWPVFAGICFMILPSIPNSVALRGYDILAGENYIVQPVSYFIHFATIFVICYICFLLIERFKLKFGYAILSLLLVMLCVPIQSMNEVNAREQAHNFNVLTATEKIFHTDAAKIALENGDLSAADIYRTRISLAVNNGYWTGYARYAGLDTVVKNEPYGACTANLYLQNDRFFILSREDYAIVLSRDELSLRQAIRINDTEYLSYDFSDPEILRYVEADNGFYRYCFKVDSGGLTPIAFADIAM